MPIKSQSWSNPKANLEPIRTQSLSASGANPCQSGVNFSSPPKAADCPIHANVCQHSPIRCRFKLSFSIMFKFANQCQFNIPLTVNSTSILQSDTILPPLEILFPTNNIILPTQCQSPNHISMHNFNIDTSILHYLSSCPMQTFQSANSKAIHQSCTEQAYGRPFTTSTKNLHRKWIGTELPKVSPSPGQ